MASISPRNPTPKPTRSKMVKNPYSQQFLTGCKRGGQKPPSSSTKYYLLLGGYF